MKATIPTQASAFVEGLDAAIQAHMNWTRRVLRCAVLHASPGEDVLAVDSHERCSFGHWFRKERAAFDQFDAASAAAIDQVHEAMHSAIARICANVLAGDPGNPDDLEQFESAQDALIHLLSKVKTEILTFAARHDPLTGLPMRYGIEQEFELCRRDALRHGESLYAVMMDIDYFKVINDTHGHPAGDEALRQFAIALKTVTRDIEPLFRFGGEEFLLLLRSGGRAELDRALDRILAAIRNVQVTWQQTTFRFTATLGVAKVLPTDELSMVIEAADAALYKGKTAGRDRIAMAANMDRV